MVLFGWWMVVTTVRPCGAARARSARAQLQAGGARLHRRTSRGALHPRARRCVGCPLWHSAAQGPESDIGRTPQPARQGRARVLHAYQPVRCQLAPALQCLGSSNHALFCHTACL
jgi:hypothetical protein